MKITYMSLVNSFLTNDRSMGSNLKNARDELKLVTLAELILSAHIEKSEVDLPSWLQFLQDRKRELLIKINTLYQLLKKRGSIVYRRTLIKLVYRLRKYLDLVSSTFDSQFTKIIELKFVMKEIENEKFRRA